jgi:hypothetical protein
VIHQRLKRCWFIGAVILSALPPFTASATEPVRSVDIVEASAFLEGYRVASEAHSLDFYDLYSDRAVVHVRIQDHERGVAFQGRAFKAWGRQLLTEGRSAPDSSIFHEATVEQRGTRLLIRAKRYSTAKCYWDLSYQVGIEREGISFRIVDERLTTQPTASCRSTRAVVNISGNTSLVTPSGYTPSPMSGSLRAPDSESMTPWHPLSQQQLSDKAMQLAQQFAAARASQFHAAGMTPKDLIGAAPASLHEDRSTASLARPDVANDLRVTPEP